jgi:hypothetical protein
MNNLVSQIIIGAQVINKDSIANRYLTPIKIARATSQGNVWLFVCICGTKFERLAKEVKCAIKEKRETSCGCIKAKISKRNGEKCKTHGASKHRLYSTHRHMMQRCYNPDSSDYKFWGARGISVCEDWHNVNTFIKWSEENGYNNNLTIERIDVDKNYMPSNCTWIENKLQAKNTRRQRMLTYKGETLDVSDFSRKYKLNRSTVMSRLNLGWDCHSIVTIPPGKGRNQYG